MASVILHKNAHADLLVIRQSDRQAAVQLSVFLQELQGDPSFAGRLTDLDYSDQRIATVKGIWSLHKQKLNVYRCEIYVLEGPEKEPTYLPLRYRILYAYDQKADRIVVFAIVHRSKLQDGKKDYDVKNPYIQRAAKLYEELSLPYLP